MEIDVKHVAELARIRLTQEEMLEVGRDLRSILDHIERLSEIDVEGVPPTFGPAKDAGLRPAPDEVKPCLPREALMKLAPATQDGNVLVPKEAPGELGESGEPLGSDGEAR